MLCEEILIWYSHTLFVISVLATISHTLFVIFVSANNYNISSWLFSSCDEWKMLLITQHLRNMHVLFIENSRNNCTLVGRTPGHTVDVCLCVFLARPCVFMTVQIKHLNCNIGVFWYFKANHCYVCMLCLIVLDLWYDLLTLMVACQKWKPFSAQRFNLYHKSNGSSRAISWTRLPKMYVVQLCDNIST